MLQQT
ncbi:hypothetical protein D020_0121A, partial [Vibrio parahaemolyticus SBR10290]